ncbi:hypothetical protein HK57_00632 [Aspergillus ustus]|uniref:Uncharacterized protein n=1 Tax=Aspergillus ustus TaxID=40382 RepID=A0A0C1C4F8_ASPUT|nr:hypothetical protein HK57_00632 [Aspergillus ustus]
MAAPAEMTVATLAGQFVPNKSLSDDADSSLALQGVSWILRKGISLASPKFILTQSTNENGVAVVNISVGGVGSGATETRVLDWEPVDGKNPLFGKTQTRSRLYKSALERSETHSDEDYAFLNGTATKDGAPSSWAEDASGQNLQCVIVNDEAGWTMEQVWGFEEIDGKRYHTRRSVVRKDNQVERGRLVYNYVA